MSGIYIHIPFCVNKCSYCNFYSSTKLTLKQPFIAALCREMEWRKGYLQQDAAQTLYFGGGTPSVLTPKEIEHIITSARQTFGLLPNAEITLEANPNNLNETYLKQLANTSVNRLSIGIQSFFDSNLQTLGRIHTATQAEKCIELAYKYGFPNLSIDLMYGYPQLTLEQWYTNLMKAKDVPHLSCYSLSLEPNSALFRQVSKKHLLLPDEEQVIEQYRLLKDFAKTHDFIHYETSNFCKPNRFSKHNTAYWQDEMYVGLGAAAHSFNRTHRGWNIANVEDYIRLINRITSADSCPKEAESMLFEQETLSPVMRVNEYIMTSLRTMWGCDLNYIKAAFGKYFLLLLMHNLKDVPVQYYSLKDDTLLLSDEGSLFTDAIACTLFLHD
ncbi:MAG: radical SAM family heme chaperone HemW [Bacteroidales bacterium]|nr:radical SAM family heme chaperone HemW [Bacteroidales bacterium]